MMATARSLPSPAKDGATRPTNNDRLPVTVAAPIVLALAALSWLAVWAFIRLVW